MTRTHVWFFAVLLTWPSAAADAGEDGPMCRREEVVAFVARAVRKQNAYAELDESSIGEIPTGVPNEVLCAANLVERRYDYRRYRMMTSLVYQEYAVQKIEHGYQVSLRP